MYPGELGCYSSHYAAWTAFLASGAPQLVVLEDDTIVDWNFLVKLAKVDLQAAGVRYLRLYAKHPCAFRRVLRNAIEQQRSLIEFFDRPYGTQGYVITRDGAQRFVSHCRVVPRPLDDALDRWWDHGVPNLCVFPFPVIEKSTVSSIGPARFDQFRIPPRLRARRYQMKLTDRLLKLREGARRLSDRQWPALRSLAVG